MRVDKVSFQNLKGASDSVTLGPATFIYGRNFRGKTTILDAIKLALLGYHPAHDKTAAGVMELASGNELVASVELDTGIAIGHKWLRSAAGKTTRQAFIPLGWPNQPVAVLDASAYFGLSDRGKIDYLFSVASVEGSKDEARKLLDAYGPVLGAEIAAKVGTAGTVQTWLDGALTATESLRSEAAANTKRFTLTQQGTAQLGDFSTPPPIDLPVQIQNKVGELDAARIKLRDLERGQRNELALNTDLDEANRKATEIVGMESRRAEIIRERDGCAAKWKKLLAFEGVCPMCGSDSADWHKGAAKMRGEELALFERRLGAATEEIDRTRTLVDNLRRKGQRAVERIRKKNIGAVDDAELVIAELTQGLAELNKQQYRYNEYIAERRRLESARTEAEKNDRREKALKAIKLKLVEAKARLLEATFGPILNTVAMFTKGVLRFPLVFREGELGYFNGPGGDLTRWIPYRTFSGTEEAIAFAAFQAAIAVRAPVRLAILDEIDRLDRDNKAVLLGNVLAALKAGAIDQFICVGVSADAIPEGFLLIERK